MKAIKELCEHITDEIDDAKEYAEMYVYSVAKNDGRAESFKMMTQDELKHANIIHGFATEEIERLKTVFTPPDDMVAVWERTHDEYVKTASWIKSML